MTILSSNLDEALARFGLPSFRPGQREVIETIVAGKDCMCVMPTGGGKSLCYQLPSVIRPGLTIVVSPLIALMKDQVDSLCRHGIPAELINSSLSQSEQQSRLQAVAAGKYQLVYVAPERLRNSRFLDAIRATPVQLLAIDEAHCISQWGHDFRPDYARIGRFREWLGGVQTVALTATATPRVREDIVRVLGLDKPRQFMSGFARPNLHFGVVQKQSDREKDDELADYLAKQSGAGIIYAATRKRCEALVEMISEKLQIPVGAYHAGLLPMQRQAVQERFMKNQLRVIVATNAFGMGIDKPDLRFVIHYNMPGSLEAYYQEAGRAGRDGKHSQTVMLYSYQDRYIQEFFIENNYPAPEVIRGVYEFLCQRDEDPIELTQEEIRDSLGLSISPEAIGSSLQVLSRTGVLERLEMGGGLAMVRLDSNLPTLVDLLPREAQVRRKVLRLLERAVGDRRGEQVYLHPRWLLQESAMPREALSRALRELTKLEEVDYVPPFRGRAVHFKRRDVPFEQLSIDFDNLRSRKEAEYDRLNQVVGYAQSPLCRQATIRRYFGDSEATNCGQCDRCQRRPGWPRLPATSEPAPERSALGAAVVAPTPQPNSGALSSEDRLKIIGEIVEAIERVHGRLGKHLIAQYLCGSQNAKIQKLRLHRLSAFGLLDRFRQADGVALLETLLAAGILRQQEANRNRPTLSVAPELVDIDKRQELLRSLELPVRLEKLLATVLRRRAIGTSGNPATGETVGGAMVPGSPATESAVLGHSIPQAPAAAVATEQAELSESARGQPETAQVAGKGDEPGRNRSADEQPTSGAGTAQTTQQETSQPDWRWTLALFKAGHPWGDVRRIRRMSDEELAASLNEALRGGATVERGWVSCDAQEGRSTGQQRVLREMRRRAAAGVG